MRVTTKIVFSYTGEILEHGWFDYIGPVAICKGASADQKNLEQSQSNFYNTLVSSYNKMFEGQNAILSSLTSAWTPILNAGPGQKGYTPQEETAIRTSASDTNAQQFANAQKALNENLAARGGGNVFLPSGAEDQLQAGLVNQEAQTEAQTQNQITQQNYEIGRQNFQNASAALGGTAQTYNPTSAAGQATGAGSTAADTASTIQKANAAASPWATIGGILGGAASSFAGGFAKPLGSAVAAKI